MSKIVQFRHRLGEAIQWMVRESGKSQDLFGTIKDSKNHEKDSKNH
jgi:hypothetical protein